MTKIKDRYDARWKNVKPMAAESDNWAEDGKSVFQESVIEAVRRHLEDVGAVVVEHWHYRESRAPTLSVFSDFEEFAEHLECETKPGDAVDIYAFPHEQEPIASGKCPDLQGRVPKGGAY